MKRALVIVILIIVFSSSAYAQPFRYMDESGNILWADSLDQVPMRYRGQVVKPTPIPVYSPWQYRQMMKKKRKTPTPRPTRVPKPTKAPKVKRSLTPSPAPIPPPPPTPTPTSTLIPPISP